MIHGYDYQFIRAPNYYKRHGTWVKVPMIKQALGTYETVVFLDADAVFAYPEIPFEWLMSLWNITDETLVAMSNDPDSPRNRDKKGSVMMNTGFIIARQSTRTLSLFHDWNQCPTETKYEGCKRWMKDWAHEQAAFSNHVRYDYSTDDVRAIPRKDGNGGDGIVARYGAGYHAWEIRKPEYYNWLKWFYASTVVYIPASFFTKATILLLMARVFAVEPRVSKGIRIFIWALLVAYVPIQILRIVNCYPIRTYWDPKVHNAHCLNQRKIFFSDLSLSIVTDLIILLVPIPLTCRLNLSVGKRIKIVLLLGAGGIATALTLFRVVKAVDFLNSDDITVDYTPIAILTNLEITIGFVCACLPSLNMLIEHHIRRRRRQRETQTDRRDRSRASMIKRHFRWMSSTTHASPPPSRPPNRASGGMIDLDVEMAMLTGQPVQLRSERLSSTESIGLRPLGHRLNSGDGRREGWLSQDQDDQDELHDSKFIMKMVQDSRARAEEGAKESWCPVWDGPRDPLASHGSWNLVYGGFITDLRGDVRQFYGIDGNDNRDCFAGCCKPCCTLIRVENEIIGREKCRKPSDSSGYTSQPPMSSSSSSSSSASNVGIKSPCSSSESDECLPCIPEDQSEKSPSTRNSRRSSKNRQRSIALDPVAPTDATLVHDHDLDKDPMGPTPHLHDHDLDRDPKGPTPHLHDHDLGQDPKGPTLHLHGNHRLSKDVTTTASYPPSIHQLRTDTKASASPPAILRHDLFDDATTSTIQHSKHDLGFDQVNTYRASPEHQIHQDEIVPGAFPSSSHDLGQDLASDQARSAHPHGLGEDDEVTRRPTNHGLHHLHEDK
ncbi:hypothetical protein HG531_008243 [Fusarium graminearum]|nr:hypothetical protein HG531_008243 [Fusarium graminearum]